MEDSDLKERFEKDCNDYAKIFSERLFGKDASEMFWVGDRIGGVFFINDFFVKMDDIRYIVDNNVDFETFNKWYYYNIDISYGERLFEEKAVPFNLDFWVKNEDIEKYLVSENTRKLWKERWFKENC